MSTTSPNMGLTIPDVNDEVTDTINDLAANFTFLDAIYPVGSIYLSTTSTNPSSFLGGTWTRITDRFLMCGGTTYTPGTTGGAAKHNHYKAPAGGSVANVTFSSGSYVVGTGNYVSQESSLPPYLSVYAFERTA